MNKTRRGAEKAINKPAREEKRRQARSGVPEGWACDIRRELLLPNPIHNNLQKKRVFSNATFYDKL